MRACIIHLNTTRGDDCRGQSAKNKIGRQRSHEKTCPHAGLSTLLLVLNQTRLPESSYLITVTPGHDRSLKSLSCVSSGASNAAAVAAIQASPASSLNPEFLPSTRIRAHSEATVSEYGATTNRRKPLPGPLACSRPSSPATPLRASPRPFESSTSG